MINNLFQFFLSTFDCFCYLFLMPASIVVALRAWTVIFVSLSEDDSFHDYHFKPLTWPPKPLPAQASNEVSQLWKEQTLESASSETIDSVVQMKLLEEINAVLIGGLKLITSLAIDVLICYFKSGF